jgi:hypothetical protein
VAEGYLHRPFSVTVGGHLSNLDDLHKFEDAGVDRLIVNPWERTREVPEALERFAERFLT